jgi:2'-hydroxyisoflavone reductase
VSQRPTVTRRDFVRLGLAAGAAGLALPAWARGFDGAPRPANPAIATGAAAGKASRPLKILILGGTGLTGPQMIAYALPRGHQVTVFNRGRTENRKGSVGDGVERLIGDRDPKVGDGLKALDTKQTWDVVFDNSGFFPRHVRASAELLKDRVGMYVFISTVSVYQQSAVNNTDESAPLVQLADPTTEDMAGGMNYGGLKVECEKAAMEVFGKDRTAVLRPHLIVGPGDDTDRFTYWPVRVSEGGEVLAPHAPSEPTQMIDVRDLAEWAVRVAEDKVTGIFNVARPAVPAPGGTMGELLEACKTQSKSNATFTWVDVEFLTSQGVAPWADMPAWVPSSSEAAGMSTVSSAAAVAKGLTIRPLETTVKDTLDWWPKEVERRTRVGKELVAQAEKDGKAPPNLPPADRPRAGIKADREKAVLAAWAARPK